MSKQDIKGLIGLIILTVAISVLPPAPITTSASVGGAVPCEKH